MIETHPKWSKEEFICFILIYASYADLDFSQDEKQNIMHRISNGQFNDIMNEYHSMVDLEKIKIIELYKPMYYQNNSKQEELLSIIEEQFKIDGSYGLFEKALMEQLKRIISD